MRHPSVEEIDKDDNSRPRMCCNAHQNTYTGLGDQKRTRPQKGKWGTSSIRVVESTNDAVTIF